MQIFDSLALDASGLKLTRDGYLIGDAKVARAGNVQQYYGHEIGVDGADAFKLFGVYRDPDAVFDRDSMMSLAGRPVTRDHPRDGVNADNWKDLAIGQVGGVIRKDGDHVVAPMAIMDAAAAKEVSEGARSLSAGYTCTLIADEGVAADGTPYQYKQTGPIRFNHVAYLPNNNPRAGNTRIGDQSRNKPQQEHRSMKTVTIDGKAFEVTDEAAVAIAKLQADAQNATKTAKEAAPVLDQALAVIAEFKAKDEAAAKAVADAKAEADAAKAKVPTADALHAMAAELSSVVDAAKTIAPDLDVKGKTADAIKLAAVTHVVGDDAVKGKSADYIAATFDHLVASNDDDPVAKAISGNKGAKDAATTAYDGFLGAYQKTMN